MRKLIKFVAFAALLSYLSGCIPKSLVQSEPVEFETEYYVAQTDGWRVNKSGHLCSGDIFQKGFSGDDEYAYICISKKATGNKAKLQDVMNERLRGDDDEILGSQTIGSKQFSIVSLYQSNSDANHFNRDYYYILNNNIIKMYVSCRGVTKTTIENFIADIVFNDSVENELEEHELSNNSSLFISKDRTIDEDGSIYFEIVADTPDTTNPGLKVVTEGANGLSMGGISSGKDISIGYLIDRENHVGNYRTLEPSSPSQNFLLTLTSKIGENKVTASVTFNITVE